MTELYGIYVDDKKIAEASPATINVAVEKYAIDERFQFYCRRGDTYFFRKPGVTIKVQLEGDDLKLLKRGEKYEIKFS